MTGLRRFARNRLAMVGAVALQYLSFLGRHGLVQAVGGLERGDLLLGGLLAEDAAGGSARQRVQQREHDDADHEDHDERLEHAPDQEAAEAAASRPDGRGRGGSGVDDPAGRGDGCRHVSRPSSSAAGGSWRAGPAWCPPARP